MDAEARLRGSAHIRQLVMLGDGTAWIWHLADELFPGATQIVDVYHAETVRHALVSSRRHQQVARHVLQVCGVKLPWQMGG